MSGRAEKALAAASARITLSALHTGSPRSLIASAVRLERLGYLRYWVTEHHEADCCTNPAVMLAAASAATSTIRLGSAGILLSLHAPVAVAEDFSALQAMYVGRCFDLGIVGSLPSSPAISALLDGRRPPGAEQCGARIRELVRVIHAESASWSDGVRAPAAISIWICGQSERSARLAASLGIAFSFHHSHHLGAGGTVEDGRRVIDLYRSEFNRSGTDMYCNVACLGVCAKTSDVAHREWNDMLRKWRSASGGSSQRLVQPAFMGSSESCSEQLSTIADQYGVRELVIECLVQNHDVRMESFERLGDAFGLRGHLD